MRLMTIQTSLLDDKVGCFGISSRARRRNKCPVSGEMQQMSSGPGGRIRKNRDGQGRGATCWQPEVRCATSSLEAASTLRPASAGCGTGLYRNGMVADYAADCAWREPPAPLAVRTLGLACITAGERGRSASRHLNEGFRPSFRHSIGVREGTGDAHLARAVLQRTGARALRLPKPATFRGPS